jgi:hypothetical protein
MMKIVYCAIVAGLLAGCTTAHQASGAAAIKAVQTTNDTVAAGLISALCGMTIGAYERLPYPAMRRGVDALCGGER